MSLGCAFLNRKRQTPGDGEFPPASTAILVHWEDELRLCREQSEPPSLSSLAIQQGAKEVAPESVSLCL